jgi:site-specific DNA-methyltransferase (adenine-specific)
MSITLINGDCLERLKQLPAASVDCFICDLPYGCLATANNTNKSLMRMENGITTGKRADTTDGLLSGCAWDIKIALEPLWEQIRRLRKSDHTPCLMFCTTKFGYDLIKSNEKEFRYDLVWDKQRGVSFLSANKMPMRSHEMIYVFAKAGAYYNRIDIKGDFKEWKKDTSSIIKAQVYIDERERGGNSTGGDGKRCALSVIDIRQKASYQMRGGHPTEKPMDLYKFLIERYCPVNGTMLDPTAGSFNSCFAAMELDRHAIGIEKDETFYKKACDRADAL